MKKELPSGWQEFQIKDICSINYGKGLGKNNIVEGNIPVYSSGGIIGYHNESLINSKGVIIGRKGNAGSVFYSNSPFFCIDTAFYVEPNDNIDLKFLYYKLISIKLERHKIDSAVPGINRDTIYSISITVPPIDEQKRIADILSTFDDLIENLKKLIEKKEIYKKGVMQRVLTGEVRFNGFTDEWEEVYIKDVGTIITGNTPSTKDKSFWGGKHIWVTPTDINKKDIDNSERKLTDIGLSKARKLPKNTLLVTCIASIGKNSILRCEGSCNQQINAIIPNKNFSAEFLYYIFENNKEYLNAKAPASATKIISKTEFEKLSFILPKIEEQNKIAELLTLIDKDIEILKQILQLRKLQKKGVMQKLLTGEVRV